MWVFNIGFLLSTFPLTFTQVVPVLEVCSFPSANSMIQVHHSLFKNPLIIKCFGLFSFLLQFRAITDKVTVFYVGVVSFLWDKWWKIQMMDYMVNVSLTFWVIASFFRVNLPFCILPSMHDQSSLKDPHQYLVTSIYFILVCGNVLCILSFPFPMANDGGQLFLLL